jgi:hypothetical protein
MDTSGYVRVTIEVFSEGEKLTHSEEYASGDWTRHPLNVATAIYGCVNGVFGAETDEDVRLVFGKLETFRVFREVE